jgi:tRNA-splicing ligase RtcB (3'-phosphate/5'-hydroxy nucleic acid ligase)
MKASELKALGLPNGPGLRLAQETCRALAEGGLAREAISERIAAVVADPQASLEDPVLGPLARWLVAARAWRPGVADAAPQPADLPPIQAFFPRVGQAPWRQWGGNLEAGAVDQMRHACELPVAVRGALMPDAHLGYGLPIGGVLATAGAVIPYAVGVDIACRMKLSVLDLPVKTLDQKLDWLTRALESETRFGVGVEFEKPHNHPVMDQDWNVTGVTRANRDKAWRQLGTSGSGNHFVEFGELTIGDNDQGLAPGQYLAILSHSGSRGAGAQVCDYYSKLAMKLHPDLPKELRHLAWLDLATQPGQEYWAAMSLMGDYAAANHACIHRSLVKHLGAKVLLGVENHHNFAWLEDHDGQQVVVHRKGATPAGVGVMGIIPGSMASPGFLVRGKGQPESLNSASHGAGRVMSRKKAHDTFRWAQVRPLLAERKVTVLSAGIDEVPGVYKDIHEVMAAQDDLVEVLARFDPRLVKMAPAGERAED